jgi:transcriptional regulator with XRE-family HTH domain
MTTTTAETLGHRLREARLSRGFRSAAEAARQFRWNITSYQQAENGTRPPTRDKITEYARNFRVSISWLLTGDGTPEEIEIRTVPFLGHIDQDSGFLVRTDHSAESDVPAPPGATEFTVAIKSRSGGRIVRGGALLYFENRRQLATDEMVGKLCVVALDDDRIVVRRLEPGIQAGHYNLFTCVDVEVAEVKPLWAAEIIWIRQP